MVLRHNRSLAELLKDARYPEAVVQVNDVGVLPQFGALLTVPFEVLRIIDVEERVRRVHRAKTPVGMTVERFLEPVTPTPGVLPTMDVEDVHLLAVAVLGKVETDTGCDLTGITRIGNKPRSLIDHNPSKRRVVGSRSTNRCFWVPM